MLEENFQRVAFGNESFVLTRRGEPVAAIVSLKELKLLQELEDRIDVEDAWKAKKEPGEPIPWDDLKKVCCKSTSEDTESRSKTNGRAIIDRKIP